jgi:hypothetical protein
MQNPTDKRRYGVIEVRQANARTFHLRIDGKLWSEVEWSPARQTWCIQDACGFCLGHCDQIRGTHIDQRTAVALAKAMIRDGRMPTPEEAQRLLQERELEEVRKEAPPSQLPGTTQSRSVKKIANSLRRLRVIRPALPRHLR